MAIADSDSYLKWGAATLDAMPPHWRREQWLVSSPISPSKAQVAAATSRSVRTLSLAAMVPRLLRRPPDVVLLAGTGPVVQAIVSLLDLLDRGQRSRRDRRRPVIVTGLPGISVPATARAIEFRRGADCFIVHSRRERTEFEALAAELRAPIRFVLAQLPFVTAWSSPTDDDEDDADQERPSTGAIVFAAQAKVPAEPEQRRAILRALADLPEGLNGVIKVRAVAGEQQTHRELFSYADLWAELVAAGDYSAEAISFLGGSMADALEPAVGFVTVSSTAALEAIGRGLPILVLDDFGVSAEMINEVFLGSGVLGSLDRLRSGELSHPDREWLVDNYFHEPRLSDWVAVITELLRVRDRQGLPAIRYGISALGGRRRRIRGAIRLVLPAWLVTMVRAGTRTVRRTRRRLDRRGSGQIGRESGVVAEVGGEHPLADLPDGPGSG